VENKNTVTVPKSVDNSEISYKRKSSDIMTTKCPVTMEELTNCEITSNIYAMYKETDSIK